jgi:hypothetical protein
MKKFLKRLFCIHKYQSFGDVRFSEGCCFLKSKKYMYDESEASIFMCPKCGKFKIKEANN